MLEGAPPWAFAWKLLRLQRARLAVAICWSVLFIIMPMQVPILTGALVDGLNGREPRVYALALSGSGPEEVVRRVAGLLLGVTALYGVSAYFQQAWRRKITRHLIAETRKMLIDKMERMSLDQQRRFGAGDLLNRVLVDAGQLRQFVDRVVITAITKMVRVAYPLAMLFWIQPLLATVACSVLPVQWLVTRGLQRRLRLGLCRARDTQTQLATVLKEHLDGLETIQNVGAIERAVAQAAQATDRLERDETRVARHSAGISASVWTLTSLGFALSWWLGGQQVLRGAMSLGDLVVFTGLVAFVYAPFRRLTDVVDVSHRISTGLEHVKEILDLPATIHETPHPPVLEVRVGAIHFRNVSFSYGHRNALTNVDLRIAPCTLTGIAGRSGSGKSSLLRLIARMADPLEGQVLIDGQDVRGVALHSLRAQVALVPQRPILFTGTLADNLRLAKPDATLGEMEEACRAASALDFVLQLPLGFDTLLGRGGASLSSGEMQRLAIARALLMKTKILLLDEPTSALDLLSQSAMLSALQQLKQRMTIVMAAHRIEALSFAEQLVVLDRGRVIENGLQTELLSSPALYARLYETQADINRRRETC
jgi:ATP-binding cassette, subfamily B, bacterial